MATQLDVPPTARILKFRLSAMPIMYAYSRSCTSGGIRSRRSFVLKTQCTKLAAYVCDIGVPSLTGLSVREAVYPALTCGANEFRPLRGLAPQILRLRELNSALSHQKSLAGFRKRDESVISSQSPSSFPPAPAHSVPAVTLLSCALRS